MNFYSTFCFVINDKMMRIESNNSQLSGMQNEEMMITKSKSRVSDNSRGEQLAAGCLGHEPKQFFDASFLLDAALWYRKQQEKKFTHICEIIQILRTTKLQQCRCNCYNNGKFCALGAIMHEKYGWNGYEPSAYQQLNTLLDHNTRFDIMSLNDRDGKSFSEIADWLEKNYLRTV